MEQNSKEQADHFYCQGLHAYVRSANSDDMASLMLVAQSWQKAWELYRKIGDESKARELEKSLADLFKKKYLKLLKNKQKQNNIVKKFNDWAVFFKIGCFGFGGPMAVFTLLEDELVGRKNILTSKDFLEGAVLGNVLPGPVTMDIVTYTGYKLKKWSGALISTLVFILPSFVIMIILAMLYDRYSVTPEIKAVLQCLGTAVTGLVLCVGLKLSQSELKDYRELCILIWAFGSSFVFKLDIVVIVAFAGLAGIVLYDDDPDEIQVKL